MTIVTPRAIKMAGVYLALSLAFCWPLFAVPNGLGYKDWDVHLFFYGSVLKNLFEYGQLPFWNPWYCGGNVLWQNPQVALLSPAYPLAPIVGLPIAMKLTIVLHYFTGFVGMHLLVTRIFDLKTPVLTIFLGAAFTLSGALAMHLAVGHANFLPAFYLPLALFLFCLALRDGALRHGVMAGGVFALMILNGGLHIVPMAGVAIAVLGLWSAIVSRSWRPLLLTGVVAVAGMALAAPKLVPVAFYVTGKQFWDTRTPYAHPDLATVEMMARVYLDPYQSRALRLDGQVHNWYEYGNYVGLPVVLMFAAAVFWIMRAGRVGGRWFGAGLVVTTLLLLSMSAGEFGAAAPAMIATHLPLLSRFRIPSRYTIVVVLFGVATVAWGLRATIVHVERSVSVRAVTSVLCLLAALDLVVRNQSQFQGAFDQPPKAASFALLRGPTTLQVDRDSDPYQNGSPMFSALMAGRSFYRCYEVMQLVHTADPDHPLVSVSGDLDAKILASTFSPNRVEFSVVGGYNRSRVRLNQNFSSGWTSDAGPVVPDPVTGQPSVLLAPGQTGRFAFRFVPPGLLLGLMCGLGAAGLSAAVWNRRVGVPIALVSPRQRADGQDRP
jgi:hypothetical protein